MTQSSGEVTGTAGEATIGRAVADNARHRRMPVREPVDADRHQIEFGLRIAFGAAFALLRPFDHGTGWFGAHRTAQRNCPQHAPARRRLGNGRRGPAASIPSRHAILVMIRPPLLADLFDVPLPYQQRLVGAGLRYIFVYTMGWRIRDVERACGIDRHVVRCKHGACKVAGFSPGADVLARGIVLADTPAGVALKHPGVQLRVEDDGGGAFVDRPLPEELAVLVKDLDALVVAVDDVHLVIGADRETVHQLELSRPRALGSPLEQVLAVLVEFDDAGIIVAIADEEGSIGQPGDIRWAAEVLAVGARYIAFTHGSQQFLAVVRELQDLLTGAIDDPDVLLRVVGVDPDTMRPLNHLVPLFPLLDHLAGVIDNEHLMVRPRAGILFLPAAVLVTDFFVQRQAAAADADKNAVRRLGEDSERIDNPARVQRLEPFRNIVLRTGGLCGHVVGGAGDDGQRDHKDRQRCGF